MKQENIKRNKLSHMSVKSTNIMSTKRYKQFSKPFRGDYIDKISVEITL